MLLVADRHAAPHVARDLPGDAVAHETRTSEVYYMLDGSGTLVTGGTILGLKPPPAGRNDRRATWSIT